MSSVARPLGFVMAGSIAVVLSGCSLLGDQLYAEDPDVTVITPGDPIGYTTGEATIRMTGGTALEIELPLQVGSFRVPGSSDSIGFRADPWAIALSTYESWPGYPSWDVTLHRLDHGHWLAQGLDECSADIEHTRQMTTGTVRCVGLEWMDALAILSDDGPAPIPGQGPFDAVVTFEATLAAPVPTRLPGTSPAPLPRAITASHILYSPDDDPMAAMDLPLTDPAWATAERQAQAAADDLRAITDPDERVAAFRERATEGDDGTAEQGGSLGPFTRDAMVPEFADPLFDAPSLEPGDILGPIRTEFGWHVILYEGEAEPPSL